MHTMPGQMEDAPTVLVDGFHDRRRGLINAVEHLITGVGQLFGNLPRFFTRPRQIGKISRAGEVGIANDQRGIAHAMHRLLAELGGAELTNETGGDGGRPLAVGPAVFQQFPRVRRGLPIHHHHHVALLRRQFAQAQRQQHFK